jgi:hypothetical protein
MLRDATLALLTLLLLCGSWSAPVDMHPLPRIHWLAIYVKRPVEMRSRRPPRGTHLAYHIARRHSIALFGHEL